ncbi:MAG: glycosyltransferase family 39 protein [Myxococcales bacterium]|nr:glycosyltransferase family 39 protein [Myxococcales bacterium]
MSAAATRQLLIYQLALLAVRVVLASAVELSPDEAYYWAFSRSPAFWYFDHPPLVAWLIGATTTVSNSELFVRLPAILCAHGTSLLVYLLLRRLVGGPRLALVGCAVLDLSLLGLVGGVIVTPDSPFATTIAALLVGAWWLSKEPTPGRWIGFGLLLGLCGLAKYSAALLIPPIIAWVLFTPALRAELKHPGPWLAVGCALLVVTPTLIGALEHGLAGFRYQGLRALRSGGHPIESVGAYLGGQLALLGPPLAYALARLIWRRSADRSPLEATAPSLRASASIRRLCRWIAGFVWSYLLLRSLGGFVEPNWAAPAYLAALPLVIDDLAHAGAGERLRRVILSYNVVIAVLVLGIVLAGPLPLPCRYQPTARVRGWRKLVAAIEQSAGTSPLLARRYQVASLLLYYGHWATKRGLATAPLGWRASQFDHWPQFRPRETSYRLVDVVRVPDRELVPGFRRLSAWRRAAEPMKGCAVWFESDVRRVGPNIR